MQLLFVAALAPCGLMTASKAVHTLEDLAGLKLRTVGGGHTETLRAPATVPVQVQSGGFV